MIELLQKLYDVLLLGFGLLTIWFGIQALRYPEQSWAGKFLTALIKECWAGATPRSHHNIAMAVVIFGIFDTLGVLLSWLF